MFVCIYTYIDMGYSMQLLAGTVTTLILDCDLTSPVLPAGASKEMVSFKTTVLTVIVIVNYFTAINPSRRKGRSPMDDLDQSNEEGFHPFFDCRPGDLYFKAIKTMYTYTEILLIYYVYIYIHAYLQVYVYK